MGQRKKNDKFPASACCFKPVDSGKRSLIYRVKPGQSYPLTKDILQYSRNKIALPPSSDFVLITCCSYVVNNGGEF